MDFCQYTKRFSTKKWWLLFGFVLLDFVSVYIPLSSTIILILLFTPYGSNRLHTIWTWTEKE